MESSNVEVTKRRRRTRTAVVEDVCMSFKTWDAIMYFVNHPETLSFVRGAYNSKQENLSSIYAVFPDDEEDYSWKEHSDDFKPLDIIELPRSRTKVPNLCSVTDLVEKLRYEPRLDMSRYVDFMPYCSSKTHDKERLLLNLKRAYNENEEPNPYIVPHAVVTQVYSYLIESHFSAMTQEEWTEESKLIYLQCINTLDDFTNPGFMNKVRTADTTYAINLERKIFVKNFFQSKCTMSRESRKKQTLSPGFVQADDVPGAILTRSKLQVMLTDETVLDSLKGDILRKDISQISEEYGITDIREWFEKREVADDFDKIMKDRLEILGSMTNILPQQDISRSYMSSEQLVSRMEIFPTDKTLFDKYKQEFVEKGFAIQKRLSGPEVVDTAIFEDALNGRIYDSRHDYFGVQNSYRKYIWDLMENEENQNTFINFMAKLIKRIIDAANPHIPFVARGLRYNQSLVIASLESYNIDKERVTKIEYVYSRILTDTNIVDRRRSLELIFSINVAKYIYEQTKTFFEADGVRWDDTTYPIMTRDSLFLISTLYNEQKQMQLAQFHNKLAPGDGISFLVETHKRHVEEIYQVIYVGDDEDTNQAGSTGGYGGSSTGVDGGSSTGVDGGSSTGVDGGSSTCGDGGSSTCGDGGSSTCGDGGSSTRQQIDATDQSMYLSVDQRDGVSQQPRTQIPYSQSIETQIVPQNEPVWDNDCQHIYDNLVASFTEYISDDANVIFIKSTGRNKYRTQGIETFSHHLRIDIQNNYVQMKDMTITDYCTTVIKPEYKPARKGHKIISQYFRQCVYDHIQSNNGNIPNWAHPLSGSDASVAPAASGTPGVSGASGASGASGDPT